MQKSVSIACQVYPLIYLIQIGHFNIVRSRALSLWANSYLIFMFNNNKKYYILFLLYSLISVTLKMYEKKINLNRNMKIEDIELILLILKGGNITTAAQEMNLSQSAVSARLEKFRYHFDDILIQRSGSGMKLTEKGGKLLDELALLSKYIGNVFGHKTFCPYKYPCEINLYINNYYFHLEDFIPKLINNFLAFNPEHKINIHGTPLKPNYTFQLGEINNNLNIDAIIGCTNLLNGFDYEILEEHNLALVYDSYEGLKQEDMTFDKYLNLPHISVDISIGDNFFSSYLKEDHRNIILRTQNLELLKKILSNKYVVTLTKEVARTVGLNFMNLPFDTQPVPVYLLYPKNESNTTKNLWIRSTIKSTFINVDFYTNNELERSINKPSY